MKEDTTTPYSSASSVYTSESMNEQHLQSAQARLPETVDELARSSEVPKDKNNEEHDGEAPSRRE